MGCFSFYCKKCGYPIKSDSERGQLCKLFLLKDGVVIEGMEGEYDSYGRVFDEQGKSIKWNMPWLDVCDLMHNSKTSDGIVAFHNRCYDGHLPTTQSENDEHQGWGYFRKQKTPYKGGRRMQFDNPEPTDDYADCKKAYKKLVQKFTSGNDMYVERATVTKKEWDAIKGILQQKYVEVA